MQGTHVFDPALTGQPVNGAQPMDVQESASASDGTPMKRKPGRPKGSTKKNLLAGEVLLPPKIKRPVGRPRKDGYPAGSVGPARVKRERPQYSYAYSAPLPPPSLFQDWAALLHANPNAFLGTLLAALAAPNPVSSAGPTVEEAFKSHLVSLAPNPQQMQPIPSLYSILKTFWLPSSPAYFSLTASASTARTPSEHRFLYWDPQPLVFNGIACPSCSAPLVNKGRISSGPVKIYDIDKPFFIVGCEYVCSSTICFASTTDGEGRKFASTDPSILRSLPVRLKDEFPARLLHGDADVGSGPGVWNWKAMGVSVGLWNLVVGALRAGLRKEVILGLMWSVQHGVPEVVLDLQPQQTEVQSGQQPPPQEEQQQDEDDKMDEDGEEDGEDEEAAIAQELESEHGQPNGSNETQTTFTDAYGDAWKENAGMAESSTKATPTPSSGTPQPPQVQGGPSGDPVSQPLPPPPPPPLPQMMVQPPPGYNPYTAYPFTPYAYMPHHLVNGQFVPIGHHPPPGTPGAGPSTVSNGVGADGGSASASISTGPATGAAGSGATAKRSPRHCCKCGSQECKGKGGRSFCTNACQDCGKLECKGRNSRRPDKKCSEGWQ